MIYYLEHDVPDGSTVSRWYPSRSANCWGLFEDTTFPKATVFRMAVACPPEHREAAEAFVNGPFARELLDNQHCQILGYDTREFFKGKLGTADQFKSAAFVTMTFMVIELSADIPADRFITFGRLLTSFRWFGTEQIRQLAKGTEFVAPLLLTAVFAKDNISSDSYVTLWPVTKAELIEANDGVDLDDNNDEHYDALRVIQKANKITQSKESILEIVKRTSEDFEKLSSQKAPIREGYLKDDERFYLEDEVGIMSVSAPITNKPVAGQKGYNTVAGLSKYIIENI